MIFQFLLRSLNLLFVHVFELRYRFFFVLVFVLVVINYFFDQVVNLEMRQTSLRIVSDYLFGGFGHVGSASFQGETPGSSVEFQKLFGIHQIEKNILHDKIYFCLSFEILHFSKLL